MRLAGIDGCPAGWVAVVADAGNLASASLWPVANLQDFLEQEHIDLVVIDMPIGFVEGPSARDVDAEMRAMLKGKASSVFSTPSRKALAATTYLEACFVNEGTLGRRLSKQAFMLFPKMREVDRIVRLVGQERLREGHPEVSFAAMNGSPVLSRKRAEDGQADRVTLLQRAGVPVSALLEGRLPGKMAVDDILDAAAMLWSANRLARNEHITIPPVPSRDAVGLEMSVIA